MEKNPRDKSGTRELALSSLAAEARRYIGISKATATLRAYRADWADFDAWCGARDLTSLPAAPETLALYLADRASLCQVSTLQRRLTAIGQRHIAACHASPARDAGVSAVWAGIRREKTVAPRAKTPILAADLRRMTEQLPATLLGARDRALLLLGFAGAFRRSELVGLDVSDVQNPSEGLAITIRRSKTDQEGHGRRIGIPHGAFASTCPVRALHAWLRDAGITEGPLFRSVNRHGRVGSSRLSDRAVAEVVKRTGRAVGMNADSISGHSLRSGLATEAARGGASERSIMNQTGHRSVAMVRRYVREGSLFHENAAGKTGL